MDRDQAIVEIKAALKDRSKTRFSVRGGTGTAWGWITIMPMPKRATNPETNAEDIAELSRLMGIDVHHQGESIPASGAYRKAAVERCKGLVPACEGSQYWD